MKKSEFLTEGNWYKGNLHAHSTVSDGVVTPEDRAAQYRKAGYSFLALTDHNVFASYPELCTDDFLMLPATERDVPSTNGQSFCLHAVGVSKNPVPEKTHIQMERCCKEHIAKPWQQLLDEMRQAGQMIIMTHPVWSRNSPEEFLPLHGYIGIEVYNHVCELTSHSGRADYFIDCCLRAGKKVFLFAEDDCHSKNDAAFNWGDDTFGGWIQVKAKELTHEAIISAIEAGSFYASTGPEIYDYGMDEEGKVYIKCSPCKEIHFVTYPARGSSRFGNGLTEAEYLPGDNRNYVRCEVVDENGKVAYTNPIYLE